MKNRKADSSSANLMADYSELVRKALTKNDLTQAELAMRLGVKQPMISLYLNRKQAPSAKVIEKIAQLAGHADESVVSVPIDSAPVDVQEEEGAVVSEKQGQPLRKTYWIFGVAPWNWGTTFERNLWGLRHQERNYTKRIKKEDVLLFFVSKERPFGFYGAFEVAGDWIVGSEPLWADEKKAGRVIYPNRVALRPIQLGFAEYAKLAPKLRFVEKKSGRKIWIYLRGIPANLRRPIGESDFNIIVNELKKNPLKKIVRTNAPTRRYETRSDAEIPRRFESRNLREDELRTEDVDFHRFLSSFKTDSVEEFRPSRLDNPERVKIYDVVRNAAERKWVLPSFQRYFDWKKTDVKEFLESIFNDQYVGSFLLWSPGKDSRLEVMALKGAQPLDTSRSTGPIILDGQQRITSLLYAVRGPKFALKGSDSLSHFYINFQTLLGWNGMQNDPSAEIIETISSKLSPQETYRKMLFPFSELERYQDWVNGFEDYLLKDSNADRRKILAIRRIVEHRLRHILDGFEIPYILLKDSVGLDQVIEVFEKINTKGIQLGAFDLLIARLSTEGIRLRDLWDQTWNKYHNIATYSKSNEKLRYYILQALSLCFTKSGSCKRVDILDISKTLKTQNAGDFDTLWGETSDYTERALVKLENLKDGFGVKHPKVVPFITMIPILAALLKEVDERGRRKTCYDKLSRWYWSSVFTNSYSGAVESRLSSDFKEMKTWFDDGKVPLAVDLAQEEIPAKLRLSEARARYAAVYNGVLSLIALRGARDFETGLTLENSPKNDRDHIFPKAKFSGKLAGSVLNITWMSDTTNRKLKKAEVPSKYFEDLLRNKYEGNETELLEVLKSHYIDAKAYHFLKQDDLDSFATHREKLLLEEISRLVGAQSPQGSSTLIQPGDPLSNRVAMRKAISECVGRIQWEDKYFGPSGLEMLAEGIDAKAVKEVKILTSIERADYRLREDFVRFRKEMKGKGVKAELRVITDRHLQANLHDRWLISDSVSFNLPSPDTVARGQYSEIRRTDQKLPFDQWWMNSSDIASEWPTIEKAKGELDPGRQT